MAGQRVTKEYMAKFLTEVQEGAMVTVIESMNGNDWLLSVDNPDYQPDNGSDPKLVLSVRPV